MHTADKATIVVTYNLSVLGPISRERFEAALREAIQEVAEVPFRLAFETTAIGFIPADEAVVVSGPGFDPQECDEFAREISSHILPETFRRLQRQVGMVG